MSPTRELCMQIEEQIKLISVGLPLKTALLVGGNPLPNQVYRIKNGIQVAIATPGRLIEILTKELINLKSVSVLVIDEVDVMLQLGFEKQVMDIVARLPHDRQTMLFSATIPPRIKQLATDMMLDPVFVSVGEVGPRKEISLNFQIFLIFLIMFISNNLLTFFLFLFLFNILLKITYYFMKFFNNISLIYLLLAK